MKNAKDAVVPHAELLQKRTTDEVEKLFRWEYRVLDVPASKSATDLEAQLSELGNAGWECFDIRAVAETTRVTCKRRPHSALNYFKYVPGL